MLQYIRFLRRTEGVEAARKYFLDARKSPNCTYHVYVAYAMMAFCLDKDPKVIDHSLLHLSFFDNRRMLVRTKVFISLLYKYGLHLKLISAVKFRV